MMTAKFKPFSLDTMIDQHIGKPDILLKLIITTS